MEDTENRKAINGVGKEDVKNIKNNSGLLMGLPFQHQPTPWQELIRIIDTKNSWGKNEIKDEILKILAKYRGV